MRIEIGRLAIWPVRRGARIQGPRATSPRTSVRWVSSSICWRRIHPARANVSSSTPGARHLPCRAVQEDLRAGIDPGAGRSAAGAGSGSEPVLTAPVPEAGAAGDEAGRSRTAGNLHWRSTECWLSCARRWRARIRDRQPRHPDHAAPLLPHAEGQQPHGRPEPLRRRRATRSRKVMNLWLAEERRPERGVVCACSITRAEEMSAWVEELAASGSSARQEQPIVDAAHAPAGWRTFERPAVGTQAPHLQPPIWRRGAPAVADVAASRG